MGGSNLKDPHTLEILFNKAGYKDTHIDEALETLSQLESSTQLVTFPVSVVHASQSKNVLKKVCIYVCRCVCV